MLTHKSSIVFSNENPMTIIIVITIYRYKRISVITSK